MQNDNHWTLIIAIWGAVLGTLTFIWNAWKEWRERPRLSANIEAFRSLWDENRFGGIRLALRNRGRQQTTVEEISIYRWPTWSEMGFSGFWLALFGEYPYVHHVRPSNSQTAALPALLDVNCAWTGFIPLETNDKEDEKELRQVEVNRTIADALKAGKRLRFYVQCAHTNRRLKGTIKCVNF